MQKINLFFEFQKIKKKIKKKISDFHQKSEWNRGEAIRSPIFICRSCMIDKREHNDKEGSRACFRNLGVRGGGALSLKILFF